MFKFSYTHIAKLLLVPPASVVNSQHTVKGWIQSCRAQSKMMFVQVSDGSCSRTLQLVFGSKTDAVRKSIEPLAHVGAAISATGTIVASRGEGQTVEMQVKTCEILGTVADPTEFLPCAKRVPLDVVRPHHDLRPLFKTYRSIYRIRSTLMRVIH